MKTFTNEELDQLVAQGAALGYVGLGTQQIRVCSHGKRVELDPPAGFWYHYPNNKNSLDYSPCYESSHTHRVFTAVLVPQKEWS